MSKYLKYIGPTISDTDNNGNAIIIYQAGDIFLKSIFEPSGDGFYSNKTLQNINSISIEYFKPYRPYLIPGIVLLLIVSIIILKLQPWK